jgi:uncharacterized protein
VDVVGAVLVGLVAGVASGLLGVGGGVIFVPGLVLFLGLSQVDAQSTSLLAIVLVAAVGAWRHKGYGNVRMGDGVTIGVLSPLGVLGGTALSNAVPEHALALSFAAVQLYFAWRLVKRVASPS